MVCKVPLYYISFLALMLFGACDSGSVQKPAASKPAADTVISALTLETSGEEALPDDPAEAVDINSQLVLERGNYWTTGIPGFGENALQAFSGEYRIPGSDALVRIWLTRELLYYEGWTGRPSMDTVRQKTESGGTVAVTVLDTIWTAILLLPPGFAVEEEDRIISSFQTRLPRFSNKPQNVSLPAFISF
jgi:hypothetical protein